MYTLIFHILHVFVEYNVSCFGLLFLLLLLMIQSRLLRLTYITSNIQNKRYSDHFGIDIGIVKCELKCVFQMRQMYWYLSIFDVYYSFSSHSLALIINNISNCNAQQMKSMFSLNICFLLTFYRQFNVVLEGSRNVKLTYETHNNE